jgi:hypothetical protein
MSFWVSAVSLTDDKSGGIQSTSDWVRLHWGSSFQYKHQEQLCWLGYVLW